MEKREINPWTWQNDRNYVQAIEVKNAQSTLYCSGQAAVHADGSSSNADMKTQLLLAMQNLEQVISESGYELKNIIRLNVYTISNKEFMSHFNILKEWIAKNNIRQALTLFQVTELFETLKIELEATAAK